MGDCAFVLYYQNGKNRPPVLWDACNGERYSVDDKDCPLKVVGAVVGKDSDGRGNIWANIQESAAPFRVNWDLRNQSQLTIACVRTRVPRSGHRGTLEEVVFTHTRGLAPRLPFCCGDPRWKGKGSRSSTEC